MPLKKPLILYNRLTKGVITVRRSEGKEIKNVITPTFICWGKKCER